MIWVTRFLPFSTTKRLIRWCWLYSSTSTCNCNDYASLANLFVKYWFHLIKTEKRKITFHLIVVSVDFGSHSLDMFFIKKYSKVSELFLGTIFYVHNSTKISWFVIMCHHQTHLQKSWLCRFTKRLFFKLNTLYQISSRTTIPISWTIINLNSIGKLMIEMKRLAGRKFAVELSVSIW